MRRIATAGPRLLAPAIAVGAMLGLAGCGPLGPLSGGRLSGAVRSEPVSDWSSSADLEAEKRRAAAALAPFQQSLQKALQEGLAQGPEVALDVCRVRAPQIAAGASSPGIRLGRTSHKLRNPANAAAPWMEPLLAAYVASPAETAPRAVRLPDGGVGYVQPIFVQPPCLACHGESLAPEVEARIAALYPEDRATGFRVGDFRGLFWAELEADSAGPADP